MTAGRRPRCSAMGGRDRTPVQLGASLVDQPVAGEPRCVKRTASPGSFSDTPRGNMSGIWKHPTGAFEGQTPKFCHCAPQSGRPGNVSHVPGVRTVSGLHVVGDEYVGPAPSPAVTRRLPHVRHGGRPARRGRCDSRSSCRRKDAPSLSTRATTPFRWSPPPAADSLAFASHALERPPCDCITAAHTAMAIPSRRTYSARS
jgi:hypothetical protein